MLGVFVDMSYTPGPFNLALLLINLNRFSGVPERLAKTSHGHSATQSQHSVSDKLQLNCFKPGARVLLIWHF
jgi:hypothetical protein